MRFVLEFEMDDDAFGKTDDEREAEMMRILSNVRRDLGRNGIEAILDGMRMKVFDVNGNSIGTMRVEE